LLIRSALGAVEGFASERKRGQCLDPCSGFAEVGGGGG